MRLVVFGSREWPYPFTVFAHLDAIWAINRGIHDYEMHIISGGAKGVDTLAEQWADENNHLGVTKKIITVADIGGWGAWPGRSAGSVRNGKLLELGPTHALGFWDGKSRGTDNMIGQVNKHRPFLRKLLVMSSDVDPVKWTTGDLRK